VYLRALSCFFLSEPGGLPRHLVLGPDIALLMENPLCYFWPGAAAPPAKAGRILVSCLSAAAGRPCTASPSGVLATAIVRCISGRRSRCGHCAVTNCPDPPSTKSRVVAAGSSPRLTLGPAGSVASHSGWQWEEER